MEKFNGFKEMVLHYKKKCFAVFSPDHLQKVENVCELVQIHCEQPRSERLRQDVVTLMLYYKLFQFFRPVKHRE